MKIKVYELYLVKTTKVKYLLTSKLIAMNGTEYFSLLNDFNLYKVRLVLNFHITILCPLKKKK